MKITAVDLFIYDAPFRLGYHSAHLLRLKADSVIIALRFDNGIAGYGESAPRPYVTGESSTSVQALFGDLFAKRLIGEVVESVTDAERVLESLAQACRKRGSTAFQSALGAVDIALLDALGKYQRLPVCRLLGPECRKAIPWSIAIPMLPEAVIRKLHGGIVRGTFGSLKVLVGRDEAQNAERLRLIRQLFGNGIEMRIEANGQWTRDEAHAQLRRLAGFGISAVEQPVAADDLEGLRGIRETFGIPVIADESMCGPQDAERLITERACDILNIKISKVGGLLAATRIASLAASRGLPCLLGSHVGETAILTGAGLHFLVTAPGLSLVEGFSSLLFGEVSNIDDLDPEHLLGEICATRGLGCKPEETILHDWPFETL